MFLYVRHKSFTLLSGRFKVYHFFYNVFHNCWFMWCLAASQQGYCCPSLSSEDCPVLSWAADGGALLLYVELQVEGPFLLHLLPSSSWPPPSNCPTQEKAFLALFSSSMLWILMNYTNLLRFIFPEQNLGWVFLLEAAGLFITWEVTWICPTSVIQTFA